MSGTSILINISSSTTCMTITATNVTTSRPSLLLLLQRLCRRYYHGFCKTVRAFNATVSNYSVGAGNRVFDYNGYSSKSWWQVTLSMLWVLAAAIIIAVEHSLTSLGNTNIGFSVLLLRTLLVLCLYLQRPYFQDKKLQAGAHTRRCMLENRTVRLVRRVITKVVKLYQVCINMMLI